MDYSVKFQSGLKYGSFLEKYGTDQQRQKWETVHQQIRLTGPQTELLSSFYRKMKVLVMAGYLVWRLCQPMSHLCSLCRCQSPNPNPFLRSR